MNLHDFLTIFHCKFTATPFCSAVHDDAGALASGCLPFTRNDSGKFVNGKRLYHRKITGKSGTTQKVNHFYRNGQK